MRLPAGVELERYASGIRNPSNLAFDSRGRLWATSAGVQTAPSDGVWMVPRRGARPRQVVRGLFSALGLTWHRGELYVSHVVPYATFAPSHTGRVVAYSGFDGRRFRRQRVVIEGLPTGRHRVDSIVAGPGERLYLGVGSQADNLRSSQSLSATVVSFRRGGGGLRVEARGLRNPYGLAVAPLARLAAHSAPGAIAVARRFGRWGPSAFVTRFGSTFDANPTGGDVVRVSLARLGRRRTAPVERFATGFGRQEPLGAALGPDGSLYVSLWTSGRIVRLVPRAAAPAAAGRPPQGPATLLRALASLCRALGLCD